MLDEAKSDTESMDVSVVVPTYNQSAMLKRLLSSFDALTFAGSYEIILVDDCSPDDTPSIAQEWVEAKHAYTARYLRMDKNGGPGRARNAGARAAHGRIVAFTDTDCVVSHDWLTHLVGGVDATKKIMGVGGKVLALNENSMAARYYVFHTILEPPWTTQYLVSCNCCYLREAMLAVGGFEEDIPIPGGEDIAVSIRMWKEGWRFAYEPKALIHHDFNPTLQNFKKTWLNYGYGTGLVCMRLLSHAEMYPEWEEMRGENAWDSRAVRPTVTGFRSYFRALGFTLGQCRAAGLSPMQTLEIVFMWTINRLAYLRGWKRGVRQHSQESLRKDA